MTHSSAKSLVPRAPIEVVEHTDSGVLMRFNRSIALPVDEHVFEPGYWREHHSAEAVSSGRGSAWFVEYQDCALVLRHFQRGGALRTLLGDRYVLTGIERARSLAEFRLLCHLWQMGLPVPEPVAARVRRLGLTYTADLLTRRIAGGTSWSACLTETLTEPAVWATIGQMIAGFHGRSVWHADLNAHNILVDNDRNAFLIDFDKGSLRSAATPVWRQRNLARLQRSIRKILMGRVDESAWAHHWSVLLDAYERQFNKLPDSG